MSFPVSQKKPFPFSSVSYKKIAFIFLFPLLVFAFTIASPLHPFVDGTPYTDSSVFETVAMMMQRGYMPYRDSFDHKGPILYLLNYIGYSISPISGVWAVEFLFMLLTFIFIYKIARLVTDRPQALLSLLIAGVFLSRCFTGGNMSEEYAMPMISISLYIFTDYYLNQNVTNLRLLACGASFGVVLLLRPNMLTVWAINCLAIFLFCIIKKDFVSLLRFVGWFILGAAIVVLPILIWLGLNRSLEPFWADYIQFNLLYTGTRTNLLGKAALFVQFLSDPVLVIALLSMLFFVWRDSSLRIFWGLYLFCFLSTVFCASLGGSLHWHYCMPLVPMVALPFARLLDYLHRRFSNSTLAKIAVILACGILILPVWGLSFGRLVKRAIIKDTTATPASIIEIGEFLQSQTTAADSISVYGNNDLIYIYSDRPHATRYSYQFPIGTVNPAILDEYFEQLQQELPKAIVIPPKALDSRMEHFLSENLYNLKWAQTQDPPSDGYTIYMKD